MPLEVLEGNPQVLQAWQNKIQYFGVVEVSNLDSLPVGDWHLSASAPSFSHKPSHHMCLWSVGVATR